MIAVRNCFITTKKDSVGRTLYYLSDKPSLFGNAKRINKNTAEKILAEHSEVKTLAEKFSEDITPNGEYTAIFTMSRGELVVTFDSLTKAVECSKYVSENSKLFDGFVFVWDNHQWVYHLWLKKHKEEWKTVR